MQQAMRTNTHMSRQTLHSQQNNINVEPLVICGPSGVGKGTIIEGLMKRYHNHDNGDDSKRQNPFGFSVSHTTRQPRPGEEHGKHYYFMEMYEMQQQIEEGKFVEYAHVHGNLYGTSKQAITDLQQNNKITILDIDRQGVMAVKQSLIPAKYVFIAPPSMEELEGRLRGRGTETEEAIQRRLGNAAKEIEYGHAAGNFDHVIVNNDIDGAIQQLANILEEWYPQLQKKEQD
jgi:guanylate kinase